MLNLWKEAENRFNFGGVNDITKWFIGEKFSCDFELEMRRKFDGEEVLNGSLGLNLTFKKVKGEDWYKIER